MRTITDSHHNVATSTHDARTQPKRIQTTYGTTTSELYANIKKRGNSILELMAEHPPPRQVSRQMVSGLGSDLAHLEDIHERYQEHVDHMNKQKDTGFIFSILVYIVGSLTGCVLGDTIYKWMDAEHKVVNESDVSHWYIGHGNSTYACQDVASRNSIVLLISTEHPESNMAVYRSRYMQLPSHD
jgi:hypothetical protein